MRVAILTWNYLPKRAGGTEIATQNIARDLASRGHTVLVVTTRDAGLPKESMGEGFRIHRVRSFKVKLLKYAFFCFKTVLILRRFKPDVTHAQAMWMGLPAFVTKKVINKPYLIWAQGSDIYFPRLFKGPISKLVLRNANALIALTRDMKKEMQKVCNRDIFVIGNGVDPKKFGSHAKKEARYQLHIGEDERVIIFVGTLVPGKGVRYLIEAMGIIKEKQPETRLLIIGDGKERDSLEASVKRLNLEGWVTFAGRINNAKVPEYLAASDIFILPSLSEGFPNVIAEAMAAGLPVVTTNVRGLSEIVTDGRNGFLVEPENPAQLAERILFVLSDDVLRKKMSASNMAWAEQHTWEKVVDMLDGAYSGVV